MGFGSNRHEVASVEKVVAGKGAAGGKDVVVSERLVAVASKHASR